MPCLFALGALIAPRVVIVFLWLFTSWFRIFDTMLWPLLGLVFLPTTLLWFSVVQHWLDGEWKALAVVGLVIALTVDISPAKRRRRGERI